MKKSAIIISIIALCLSCFEASAIKASKEYVNYTQPDGSVIRIQLHGDEFNHWATTTDGKIMTLDKDNFYRVTNHIPVESQLSKLNRQKAQQQYRAAADSRLSIGSHKFLVILVEFSDITFTVTDPINAFHNLLNEPGYSLNGGTGSAYDFYYENGHGLFDPSFDVYGPYQLSGTCADYGGNDNWGNDVNPDGGFYEACQLADADIDFSEYDQDHDGYVDNIFFYYAGHNEAEGAGASTIWPHQYSFYYYSGKLDGVRLGSYACTSEYKSSYGKYMCGIGTFCHEFGHVLGLPDFYDTDYEQNGYCDPLGDFSMMDNGSYNNGGCTPPYLSAMERNIIGWMDEPEEIIANGNYTIAPIRENEAYTIQTENSGEYFQLECRDGSGWDKYIPSGMLVYHVDKSNNNAGGQTAKSRWTSGNKINAYGAHPCYYLVRAKDSYSSSGTPYPGSGNVKTFRGTSWAGVQSDIALNNITYSGGHSSFIVSTSIVKILSGKVTDVWGDPLQNAQITISHESDGSFVTSTTTDAGGNYYADLTEDEETRFIVHVECEDFFFQTKDVTVQRNTVTLDFTLYCEWDGSPEDHFKCGDFSGSGFGWGKGIGIMGAVQYAAEEITDEFVGASISAISFIVSDTGASNVYAIVEIGGKRVLTQEVSSVNYGGWTTVDLGNNSVIIPKDKDVYVGYAVLSPETGYPLALDNGPKVAGGGFSARYTSGAGNWQSTKANLMIKVTVTPANNALRGQGFSFIRKEKNGDFTVVPGKSLKIKSVNWTNTGDCITADVSYTDGTSETIEMEL